MAAHPAHLLQPAPAQLDVVGVAGGVGTRTVAAAVGGRDLGVFAGRPADILVCRGAVASVLLAGRVAALSPRPVVAVTAVDGARPSRALLSRLRLLEPHTSAVVLLPYVPQWRDAAAPLDELRDQLTQVPEALPLPVRRYLDAIASIQTALRSPADPDRPTTAPRLAAGRAVRA